MPNTAAVSPAFQRVVAVLHCLQEDRCRQQTASYKAICRPPIDTNDSEVSTTFAPFLNYLQSGHPLIAAEVSKSSALYFPKFCKNILNGTGDRQDN